MKTGLPDIRRICFAAVACAVALLGAIPVARAQLDANILNTRHNLSASGTGTVRALAETRVCIFCHTPHNATPLSPLWNKQLEPQVYTLYTSPTLRSYPLPQPSGPTKLCLSCHDGTIAIGGVVNPAGGITMAGSDTLPADNLSNFGLDLSAHHPVSFSYNSALPNDELLPSPPADLVFGNNDEVHCTTCHDPHDDQNGKFLLKDNRYSAICTTCHQINGWASSAHATSTASVVGILPRPPKTWPNYSQLAEWGCEVCHTPHFAPTAEQLLNFTAAPPEPFSCTSAGCHSSEPPSPHAAASAPLARASSMAPAGNNKDIASQTRKRSAHHELVGSGEVPAGERASRNLIRGAACVDCHNPHLTTETSAQAPFAPGPLQGVDGVDRNGMKLEKITYEYEVCFKCHADDSADFPFIPRVLRDINKRRAFDPSNESYHPIISMGKNLNIPSIPSDLEPDMSPSMLMYCTTCHADDENVSNGPHGSKYAPILKERYEIGDRTPESFENYALCYRCHDRTSILGNTSFRARTVRTTPSGGGHSGHLAAGAPCSACHDPHGISSWGMSGSQAGAGGGIDMPGFQGVGGIPGPAGSFGAPAGPAAVGRPAPIPGNGVLGSPGAVSGPATASVQTGTGSHTHLINFDTTIVSPKAGAAYPVFNDTGTFSGSCTLVCHGVDHDNASYP